MKLLSIYLFLLYAVSAIPLPFNWSKLFSPLTSCFRESACIKEAHKSVLNLEEKGAAVLKDGKIASSVEPTVNYLEHGVGAPKDPNSAVIYVKDEAPVAPLKAAAGHLVNDAMIDKDFPAHLQVIKVLGQGSYGRTFLVQSRADASDKFVLKAYGVKSDVAFYTSPKMVAKEWKVLNDPAVNLGHGDIIVSGKKLYLPMKWVKGKTWRQRLLEPEIVAQKEAIKEQVKAELRRLHEAGLVHHDVAPRNIMLEEGTNRVVLIDYGKAKYSSWKKDRLKDFQILEKETIKL